MINTKNLKEKLEDILKKPLTATSNEYLKRLVNYSEETKFANLNYLITQIPDDVDGLTIKNIFADIETYLENPSRDMLLVKLLRSENPTIADILSIGKSTSIINSQKDISEKVKKIINSDVLKLGEDELKNYLVYKVSTKQIIEHIYGD